MEWVKEISEPFFSPPWGITTHGIYIKNLGNPPQESTALMEDDVLVRKEYLLNKNASA